MMVLLREYVYLVVRVGSLGCGLYIFIVKVMWCVMILYSIFQVVLWSIYGMWQ